MSSLSGAQNDQDLPGDAPEAPAVNSLREAGLLRQAQNGDRAAFGQLVAGYQDRLYNAVLRFVGDAEEAAEITQEAFTRALTRLDSFRGDSAPYTWLFRIAMNLAISALRDNRRRRTFSLDGSGAYAGPSVSTGSNGRGGPDGEDQASGLLDRVARDAAIQPLAAMEKRERDQQVVAALGRVDAEYRVLLVMRDIEGFDYQQMADVLDLPLGTLKSRLFRARLALRNELKPYLTDGKK
jgi:RNA polymerase sigma-70 factor (ECF subfamily)